MRMRRFAGIFLSLVLLAGPMGFLAVDHAAFHRDDAAPHSGASSRAPCPVCQFLATVSLEAPLPAFTLPDLTWAPRETVAPACFVLPEPAPAPANPRAPPALS